MNTHKEPRDEYADKKAYRDYLRAFDLPKEPKYKINDMVRVPNTGVQGRVISLGTVNCQPSAEVEGYGWFTFLQLAPLKNKEDKRGRATCKGCGRDILDCTCFDELAGVEPTPPSQIEEIPKVSIPFSPLDHNDIRAWLIDLTDTLNRVIEALKKKGKQ